MVVGLFRRLLREGSKFQASKARRGSQGRAEGGRAFFFVVSPAPEGGASGLHLIHRPVACSMISSLQDYNYREYALRRARTGFRANAGLSGEECMQAFLLGTKELEVLQRQVVLSRLYSPQISVMESVDYEMEVEEQPRH